MASPLPFLKRAVVQARFAWLTVPARHDIGMGIGAPEALPDSAPRQAPSRRPIGRRGGRTSYPAFDRMPLRYPD